jgi:hypothetical protein
VSAILAVLLTVCTSPTIVAGAQTGSINAAGRTEVPTGTPQTWIERAAIYELAIINDDQAPVRYKVRKVNRKGDTTRVVIESKQGTVARLVERDGHALTAEEDAAERGRLNEILHSPDDFLKRQKREQEGRDYAIQLIRLLPKAMLFSFTPGQPQPAGARSQVAVDFRPDPAFQPPTMVAQALTGLEGRLWIDASTGHLTRIEGRVLRPVNFGWGMIAKIYPGGTVEFEQSCVQGKRWVYSHLAQDITLREMMVRTVNDKSKMSAWEFELLPQPMSYQDAVHALLALRIPVS